MTFIFNFPILITITVLILFIEIGISFMMGLAVIAVIFIINLIAGVFINRSWSK